MDRAVGSRSIAAPPDSFETTVVNRVVMDVAAPAALIWSHLPGIRIRPNVELRDATPGDSYSTVRLPSGPDPQTQAEREAQRRAEWQRVERGYQALKTEVEAAAKPR
jgi:hypothetical protein